MNASFQLTLSGFDSGDCGTSTTALAVNSPSLPPQPPQSTSDFVFNTPLPYEQNIARLEWRILIQVVALQIKEMQTEPNPEIEQWKSRIKRTLARINEKGKQFRPSRIPSDIVPPTAVYLAQSAQGVNWCDELIKELDQLFENVQTVGTLKIELFPLDAVPAERKVDTASFDNLPVLLATDNLIISQSECPLTGD